MQKTLLLFFIAFSPLALEVMFIKPKTAEVREPTAVTPAAPVEVKKTLAKQTHKEKEDEKILRNKALKNLRSKNN